MIELPENYEEMKESEKKLWFARFAVNYAGNGEYDGLLEDVSEEVKEAYKKLTNVS